MSVIHDIKKILLLILITFVTVSSEAQNVSLEYKNANLKVVLTEIRRQTGYDILYTNKIISKAGAVTVNVRNVSIATALNACLKNAPIQYSILRNTIVLKEALPQSAKPSLPAPVKKFSLSGMVKDAATGKIINGANIFLDPQNTITTTDAAGFFVVKNVSGKVHIRVTKSGYRMFENDVDISADKKINIQLEPNLPLLSPMSKDSLSAEAIQKKDTLTRPTPAVTIVKNDTLKSDLTRITDTNDTMPNVVPPVPYLKQAFKTNGLYLITGTTNLAFEFSLSPKTTFVLAGAINTLEYGSSIGTNAKLKHWLISPAAKYWFCKSFERSFIGVHAIYGRFNTGGISFIPFLKDYRYKGFMVGGGISTGYHWAIGRRCGIEAELGGGYLYFKYNKYDVIPCGTDYGTFSRNYWGPTKAALSFIYFLK